MENESYGNDLFIFRGKPFASTGKRLTAYFVDGFLLLLAAFAVNTLGYFIKDFYWDPMNPHINNDPYLNIWIMTCVSIPMLIYFTYFDRSDNKVSPGKRLTSIFIVDENGRNLGYKKAFIRSTLKMLPLMILQFTLFVPTLYQWNGLESLPTGFYLFFYTVIMYLVLIHFTGMNQSFHDIVVKTVVIDKRLVID